MSFELLTMKIGHTLHSLQVRKEVKKVRGLKIDTDDDNFTHMQPHPP